MITSATYLQHGHQQHTHQTRRPTAHGRCAAYALGARFVHAKVLSDTLLQWAKRESELGTRLFTIFGGSCCQIATASIAQVRLFLRLAQSTIATYKSSNDYMPICGCMRFKPAMAMCTRRHKQPQCRQ